MLHKYLEIASTPSVSAARQRYGNRNQYARIDGTIDRDGPVVNDRLGAAEAAFIGARDAFYIASVSETGWPYVQYRGGTAGFLRVLNERMLGYADFRGNRQLITTGNVARNDRVSLFLMDYTKRRRLKIFGRMTVVDVNDDPEIGRRLAMPDNRARVERAVVVQVAGFDWNCPQHITPRFTEAELSTVLEPMTNRMAELEAENAALRQALAEVKPTAMLEDQGTQP